VTDENIESLVKAPDVPGIAALPRAEVDAYLERVVRRHAPDHETANADRLTRLGFLLDRAGWARADRTLAAILAAAPTEGTLDIVCLILTGLWQSGADPGALRTLGDVKQAIAADGLGADATVSYRNAVELALHVATTTGDEATAALATAQLRR
jgi:hypothetical protein